MRAHRGRALVLGFIRALLVVASVAVCPLQVQSSPSQGHPSAQAVYLEAEGKTLASLINEERQAHSLRPLALDDTLCEIARDHAIDMIQTGYFGHTSPEGVTLSSRLRQAGMPFEKAGENLAGNTSVIDAHAMLMQSPAHRGNILSAEFKSMGVAVVSGGPYGLMIVEVFVTESQVSPAPTPAAGTP